MPVFVTFRANVSRDTCIPEIEIEEQFDAYHAALRAEQQRLGAPNGAIIIDAVGQPEIRIEDELDYWIYNLCFDALPDLLAGARVERVYSRYSQSLVLDATGHDLVLSGDAIPTVHLDLKEAVQSLYACGMRGLRFLKRLNEGTVYAGDFDPISRRAEAVRRELDSTFLDATTP